MDPISATGIASSAITFVQFAYGFLSTLYTIHDGGRDVKYDEVAEISRGMRELSEAMLRDLPTLAQSQADIALANLANQCYILSFDVSQRIQKTQAKSRRMADLLKATLKAVLSRNDIIRLQGNLDNCRAQLHLQYDVVQSTKIRALLDALSQAADKWTQLLAEDQAKWNQRNILSALRFELMDERYHTVEEAADVTFKWLYAEPSNRNSSNPRFQYPFREWLASGDGIFHISGKPGSGKSTLMKFICNHPQTRRELGKWSGEKTLVFARFFFWKPGSPMQKSLLGLVRSLLYLVLNQCPESIQDVFPQHWDNSQYSHYSTPPAIHIENKEIFDGFHGLLQNTEVFERHRFCFFVDGLDEFQEAFRTYPDLVASLHDWVKVSCGHLKLCVSSRELPTFLGGFAVAQRIRLQDLTMRDIHSLAQQSLTRSQHFLEMQKEDPAKSLDLIAKITDKSDGVFLWVILTLKTLREGLESRDSLDEIFRKLDAIPQELEEFFSFIMESVPKANREKAYCSLAYALGISKSAAPFLARRSDSSFDIRFATRNIFRWSFINDYVNNKDFANHLAFRLAGTLNLERRINSVSTYVAFMHRSIPEFLQDYLTTAAVQRYIRHFDFGDALIQTFLAVAKSVEFTAPCCFHNLTLWDELKFLVHFVRVSDGTHQALYFSKLDNLDEVLLRRYGEVYPDFGSSGWKNYHSTYWDHPSLLTPISTASHEFFHEYVLWKLQRRPELIKATQGTQIAQAILDGCFSATGKTSPAALERSVTSLRTLFKLGVEPRQVTDHVAYESMTLWELLLHRSCYYGASAHVWGAIRVMLENGAETPTWECKTRDNYTVVELQVGERRRVLKERNTGVVVLDLIPGD